MGRFVALLLSGILLLCIGGCAATASTSEELIAIAREHVPIAEADSIEIAIAGWIDAGERSLLWFVTGNEYQAHSYIPIEFEVVAPDQYTFLHMYKAMDSGQDIAALKWQSGYCFLVNNEDCAQIVIQTEKEEHIVEVEELPFVYYFPAALSSYQFLDQDGMEIF